MEQSRRVCIRCSIGGILEKLPVDVHGRVVGLIYCCERCREFLKDHNLEIYIFKNEENQEPKLERADGTVCYH